MLLAASHAPARGDLARHELIGLPVRVAASGHAGYAGLEGTVVDETQGTLTIHTAAGDKVVPKAGQTFEFTLPGGRREQLAGEAIARRPEDRTRTARPRQTKGRTHDPPR